MKKKLQRPLCALLCTAMLSGIPLGALSYTGLGEVTHIKRDTVGDGLYYSELRSTDADGKAQQSYIFEYDPSGGVLPIVRWGNTVYGKDRLGSLVSAAKNNGSTVLGAVNGDFYSMQTGVPLGVMIDGGRLISTDDSKYAIGFKADGTAVVGKPSVKMKLVNLSRGNTELEIDQLNKYPTVWGVYMVTEDFSSTTLSAVESREIIIELDGDIKQSGTVTGKVRDIIEGDYNTSIPDGCAVITVAASCEDYPLYGSVKIGDSVAVATSCAEGWEDVVTAIGGGDMILENGVMPDGIIDEDHEKIVHPRTAVGIKADGTVVFFAADGRTSTSRGLKLTDLAAVMAELGCVTALNLDGGGSTTVMVKASSDTECVYVNVPADTSYRSLANGILFVSKNASDGKPSALSVTPNTPYLLAGSTVGFSATVLDSAYMPIGINVTSDSLTATLDGEYAPEVGTVSGGTFTAGSIPGEYRIKATYPTGDSQLEGDVSVLVTDKLDSLTVSQNYVKVNPGTLVEINIDAMYNERQVIADAKSFYYTLNGTHVEADQGAYPGAWLLCDLGYLDFNGNFQSFGGDYEGEVEIGITYGDHTRSVTVNIGTGSDIIADFEDSTEIGDFRVSSGGGDLHIAPASYGYKSAGALEVGFSYAAANGKVVDIKPREAVPMSTDARSIKLWVYGDISGILTAAVLDEAGNSYDLSYTVTKDYSKQLGWRELTAEIPASLKGGTLYLSSLLGITAKGTASRVIAIDNALIYYGEETAAPIDGISEHWAAQSIYTLYDMGVIQNYDCEVREDGSIYYAPDTALTRGEFAKILTLWSGINAMPYIDSGVTLEEGTPADKTAYIRAAIANGIMSGRTTLEDGTVVFDAGAAITREEAFKVIGSLIEASEGALTFTDSTDISDWAKSGIAKCVGAGIVSGYTDNTVRPKANISRAELATILGKIK